MKRFAAAALGVCLLGGVVACSAEKPSSLPTPSESSASEVTQTPTPTPTAMPSAIAPSAAKKPDSKGQELFVGRITATTADQKAVANVWVDFWRMRVNALHAAKLDPAAASQYVNGKALDDIVGYIAQLNKKELHVEGDLMVGVSSVSVSGRTATVESCLNDWSIDVDAKGVPKSKPSYFFQTRGTVTKVAGGWRVSRAQLTSRLPCSP